MEPTYSHSLSSVKVVVAAGAAPLKGFRAYPRSPGTHIVGSWVIDSIRIYTDPRTGTQYIYIYIYIYMGNWASRVRF